MSRQVFFALAASVCVFGAAKPARADTSLTDSAKASVDRLAVREEACSKQLSRIRMTLDRIAEWKDDTEKIRPLVRESQTETTKTQSEIESLIRDRRDLPAVLAALARIHRQRSSDYPEGDLGRSINREMADSYDAKAKEIMDSIPDCEQFVRDLQEMSGFLSRTGSMLDDVNEFAATMEKLDVGDPRKAFVEKLKGLHEHLADFRGKLESRHDGLRSKAISKELRAEYDRVQMARRTRSRPAATITNVVLPTSIPQSGPVVSVPSGIKPTKRVEGHPSNSVPSGAGEYRASTVVVARPPEGAWVWDPIGQRYYIQR